MVKKLAYLVSQLIAILVITLISISLIWSPWVFKNNLLIKFVKEILLNQNISQIQFNLSQTSTLWSVLNSCVNLPNILTSS